MSGNIFDKLRELEEKRFTPGRMRDAARLLRLASNVFALSKTKELCLTYADMLDRLAAFEVWKEEATLAEWKRLYDCPMDLVQDHGLDPSVLEHVGHWVWHPMKYY